jgi:hypothetical protein
MKNLFIMHTQFNLIISCGIVDILYNDDINILILHSEFTLGEFLEQRLRKTFHEVYIIQHRYMNITGRIRSEYHLNYLWRMTRSARVQRYDRIFMSQERIFDTILLSAVKRNGDFRCIHIEEDCYFSLDSRKNVPGYSLRINNSLASKVYRRLCEICHSALYGINTFYHPEIYFYGMSPIYDESCVMFPDLVRSEIARRVRKEITTEMLRRGIYSLYSDTPVIKYPEKCIVFFFDLVERYQNPDIIIETIDIITNFCIVKNITLIYKYHPREEYGMKIKDDPHVIEIEKSIPSEKIIADIGNNQVLIIGNASTACQVASKFKYPVISIAKMEMNNNIRMLEVFNQMGMHLPSNLNELASLLAELVPY